MVEHFPQILASEEKATTCVTLKKNNKKREREKKKEKKQTFFYNCVVLMGFLPWEIRVAFPGESQLRQSRATKPTVHAGCFSVSIIHRTLTWTTGSLTCERILVPAIDTGVYRHRKRVH